MQSLSQLLNLLLDAHVDFVLIGGFASVVHGSSMVTQDLDVCMLMNAQQIEKLRVCLKDFHPRHRMMPTRLSFLDVPQEISHLKNIYLETDLGVLDIVSEVSGVGTYQRLIQKADEITIFGKKCKIISINDLITSKKSLARPKDLAVVRELEAIHQLRDC